MRRSLLVLTLSATVVGLTPVAAQAATADPYPKTVAAAGDSISRGFDANFLSCFLRDCPQYSWSTGTGVNSHYLRLKTLSKGTTALAYNDAKTGAKMDALAGQLASAAAQNADYVTVLMGANDLCTSSAATMTPPETFRAQFQGALKTFVASRPGAKVFVSSIPDLYQLWSVLHTNYVARATWSTFGICPSMLSSTTTDAMRQLVVQREIALNAVLAQECTAVPQCRWDKYATNHIPFTAADVSTVDYFHPSVAGQQKLATATWGASYWP